MKRENENDQDNAGGCAAICKQTGKRERGKKDITVLRALTFLALWGQYVRSDGGLVCANKACAGHGPILTVPSGPLCAWRGCVPFFGLFWSGRAWEWACDVGRANISKQPPCGRQGQFLLVQKGAHRYSEVFLSAFVGVSRSAGAFLRAGRLDTRRTETHINITVIDGTVCGTCGVVASQEYMRAWETWKSGADCEKETGKIRDQWKQFFKDLSFYK